MSSFARVQTALKAAFDNLLPEELCCLAEGLHLERSDDRDLDSDNILSELRRLYAGNTTLPLEDGYETAETEICYDSDETQICDETVHWYTMEELTAMPVKNLREILKTHKCKSSGPKTSLIACILDIPFGAYYTNNYDNMAMERPQLSAERLMIAMRKEYDALTPGEQAALCPLRL